MIKLFKLLKPHKKFAIFTVILAAISNVMTLGFPFMMSMHINNGISNGELDYIKKIGIVMLISMGIMNIMMGFRMITGEGITFLQS